MKERLQMLEEIQEHLEMLDEAIWEAVMKVDEIYTQDFRISSAVAKIASRLESAREQNQVLLSEVLMEIDQYEPDRDVFNWRDE
jgi:predicted  nucleic acid-binding Zn-ribbon protein